MSLFDLTGKTAFVTGASRGIGRVIAVALADAGADVALVARSADGLAETAAAVEAVGGKAIVIPTDVTNYDAVAAAAGSAIDQLGVVDIVVNNAGGSNFMVPFRDLRLSGWDKLIQLNLSSAVYVCHAFAPHLLDRGTGSVINVASVTGLAASPLITPYGAAKAGLISLTKSLAVEWGTAGVRVNALCPGWTATELNRTLWEDPDVGPATVATSAMKRWASPEEMAGPALFLASDASSFMTGPGTRRRRWPDDHRLTAAASASSRKIAGKLRALPARGKGPQSVVHAGPSQSHCASYSVHHSSSPCSPCLPLAAALAGPSVAVAAE